MPTKPTPDIDRAAFEAWQRSGKTKDETARELGISSSTFRSRIKRHMMREEIPDGMSSALTAAGLDVQSAKHGWRVIQHEDGSRDSVFWRAPPISDDTLERIREAFEGMEPAQPIAAPEKVMEDLCAVWPIMDLHFGMHAWDQETGDAAYDTKRAADDLQRATEKVLALTPFCQDAILILGGDSLHADDDLAQTPRSKHALDVDGRQYRVIDRAIRAISFAIERIGSRCANLTVRVLRGNHDENAHAVLSFALAERYRNDPKVTVEKNPRDLFMRQWGNCAIFAHHGDKARPQQMVMYLADVCPFWSETRHRHYFTGHLHHDHSKDFPGVRFEQLRAFCPPDAYAASMGYGARRAMQAIVFDKRDGIVLRALDPIS